MKQQEKFSWKKRAESFRYAFAGIKSLFVEEHNARIHAVVAVLVVVFGFVFSLSALEWIAVILCVGGVFMAEAFNSAIEALADKVSTQTDPLIKKAKDVAAAAVLLFVCAAVAVGLIIFIPKILSLFQ